MDLDFARIECEIVADNSVQLTAALYVALRSFEEHFKASCCSDRQDSCNSCPLHPECPYSTVFDQRLSPDPEIVRIHQKPSLPFSLYINTMGDSASSCYVGMVVIGSAVNYIRYFHKALLSMIDACVCKVLSPEKYILHSYSLDYQGIRHLINVESLSECVILLSGRHILLSTVHSDSLKLTLKSPLRLLSNSSNLHNFDFAIFLRSQLRRCSSLYSYYGTGELDLDFVGLSQSAQNVTVLEDNIHYTKPIWPKRSNRSGLAGEAEFTGLVEPMFSLLTLGSCFNAGKGAAFGSGFHQIEVID
ncbi:MAG: CRISPR system precrRNA processing endoribonuclease RAMP protein Cas6 [Geobacteraceae bacterium]|nr:CRISPR system precrRNA processing endoribonuclease RAMP protein Cas6 [Geobacteraceae bacterium]NTW80640.1 CRISPR system precrRNA processing endoribonuclease RAMP protein Cas6 [Geobacteraceae bacterium]